MDELLLLHILTGEATIEEKENFYDFLDKDESQKELFLQAKKLWLLSSMSKTDVDANAEFKKIWDKLIDTKQHKPIYKTVFRYAAVIIFILGLGAVGGYYFSKSYNKVQTEYVSYKYTATRGSVSIVEFSDGTKVWLNSESELTFKEDHKNKQRLAELTGEAYFQVAHREDCPFNVKVGNIVIRDLGTTFNIKAYPNDKYIETSLVEGKADILSSCGKSILTLSPGESAIYHSTENKIKIRKISENVLSAWRDGKFVIRDQRMEDIFKELSRWYGVEFQFKDDKFKDYRFTGNIKKSTTALHVLKVLKTATDFNYKIVEKVEEPDVIIIY